LAEKAWIKLAVELKPYGSKNLDGYRRAVVPPIHKPWELRLSVSCIARISLREATYLLIKQIFNSYSVVLFTCKRSQSPLTAWKSSMFTHPDDSVYDLKTFRPWLAVDKDLLQVNRTTE
jgi:hypothetical protein